MRYRPGALLYVGPALLYVGMVFYFGSIRVDPLASVDFDLKDKVLHALAFGGMQVTLARALAFGFPSLSRGQVAVRSAALATFFGGLLEVWQAALPYRFADPFDFLADAVGAVLAACLWWKLGAERTSAASG